MGGTPVADAELGCDCDPSAAAADNSGGTRQVLMVMYSISCTVLG